MARSRYEPVARRVAFGAIAVATLAASTAIAESKRVAVAEIEIGGDGAPELQSQLAESIASGLEAGNSSPIKLAEVRKKLRTTPELLGCVSSTCLARLGELFEADGFVRGQILAEGSDYTVVLELYNTSELTNRIEKACSVCTIGELNSLAKTTATLLIEGATDSPVQVTIRTEPSGAQLTIDGLGQGLTPFEGPLAPGPHLVVVTSPSGKTVRERIEISEKSAAEPLTIRLEEPAPVVIVDNPPGSSPYRLLKWPTLGGAVVMVALGTTLIVIDGRGTCGESDRECPRVLNTLPGGLISLAVGAGLAGAAGYMFWADSRPRATPVLGVNSGGAQLGVRFRF